MGTIIGSIIIIFGDIAMSQESIFLMMAFVWAIGYERSEMLSRTVICARKDMNYLPNKNLYLPVYLIQSG